MNNNDSAKINPLTPDEFRATLRARVSNAKELLPKNWRKRLVTKYPMYDKLEFASLLDNIYFLRSTDVSLTNILEEIAREYQEELKLESQEL